jgi:uncharacterized membrane protein
MFSFLLIGWGLNVANIQQFLSVEKFSIIGVVGSLFLCALVFPFTIAISVVFLLFMLCCGKSIKKQENIKNTHHKKNIKHETRKKT